MKKLLLLFVMVGAFLCASAQVNMCKSTGGVESTSIISGDSCDEIVVILNNTNSYKVTVDMTVTVVDKYGNETIRQKTVVIPANKNDKKVNFRTKKVKGETMCADVKQCTVSSLNVSMCD